MTKRDCPSAEALAALVDGRPAEAEQSALEAHLADCADCRREALELADAAADVAASLLVPSADWKRRARALVIRPRRRLLPWLAGAGALAAAALAVAFLNRTSPPVPPSPAPLVRKEKKVEAPPVPSTVEAPKPAPETAPPPAPPPEPPKPPPAPAPREAAPEKKPDVVPPPLPPPPAPSPAAPAKPVEPDRRPTLTVVAKLLEAEGEVFDAERRPLKAGVDLLAGQGVTTGRGRASVGFPDGTRIDLAASTTLKDLKETEETGKRLAVGAGIVTAMVAKQAPGRPVVFATPQAEARVLGTTLRLAVEEGATRLDVLEGRVRLQRSADGKALELTAGQFAVAAPGQDLVRSAATGLVAHWKLDDGAADASGNLNHGDFKGPAEKSPGRLAGGMKFGPAGFLSVPEFRLPERFTVAFWVHQAAHTNDQDWFLNFGGNQFILIREGNMGPRQIRVGWSGPPQDFLTVPSAVKARQWVHLAVSFDGAELRLFADGQSVGSKKSGPRAAVEQGFTAGRMGPGGEGSVDDVRVYDRALTLPEIQSVLRGGHALPSRR
jgi:ferric-dicitrate binding protein FerR (iron transport regulator)